MPPVQSKSEQDYRAEDDHRTLQRAAEITSDSSRMAGVKRHHAKVTRAARMMDNMLGSRAPEPAGQADNDADEQPAPVRTMMPRSAKPRQRSMVKRAPRRAPR